MSNTCGRLDRPVGLSNQAACRGRVRPAFDNASSCSIAGGLVNCAFCQRRAGQAIRAVGEHKRVGFMRPSAVDRAR